MRDFTNCKTKRVESTDLCDQWIDRLSKRHGPLMFYQSGGCCEGSAPLCMKKGEMRIGDSDVLLGVIHNTPFYISGSQYEVWKHTKVIVDVVDGGGNAFSLESPEGISFHIRSKVFTEDEQSQMDDAKSS